MCAGPGLGRSVGRLRKDGGQRGQLPRGQRGRQGPHPRSQPCLRAGIRSSGLETLRCGFQGSEIQVLVQTPQLPREGCTGADIGGERQRGGGG